MFPLLVDDSTKHFKGLATLFQGNANIFWPKAGDQLLQAAEYIAKKAGIVDMLNSLADLREG